MLSNEDETSMRRLHEQYMQALGSGDMAAVADLFTFPAVLKGFLDDIVVAEDNNSLLSAYDALIAAAPKAQRLELLGLDLSYIRPQVFLLTMNYKQFDASDALLHTGQALYFMKPVDGELKLFAVV